MATTDIYRIKTRNSIYEIQVRDSGISRCRREGESWRPVTGDSSYLEKLCIGPSFDVPGVVQTSNVEDYAHFVLSTEPKRKAKALQGSGTGIPEFFGMVAEHVKEQAQPQAVMVAPDPRERVEGCAQCESGPVWHNGSRGCKSGSIASGGSRAHCTCDYCF
jgi:hypothetical protein